MLLKTVTNTFDSYSFVSHEGGRVTGTLANTAEEQVEAYALDPPTLSADIEERQAEAIYVMPSVRLSAPLGWRQDSGSAEGACIPARLHRGNPVPDAPRAASACDEGSNIVNPGNHPSRCHCCARSCGGGRRCRVDRSPSSQPAAVPDRRVSPQCRSRPCDDQSRALVGADESRSQVQGSEIEARSPVDLSAALCRNHAQQASA